MYFYSIHFSEFERLSHEGRKVGEEEEVTEAPVRRKSRAGSAEVELPATGSSKSSPRAAASAGAEEEGEEGGDNDDDADDTSCGVEEEGQAPKASDMLIKESKV